jgi:phospholipid transport system substrate-binding protein
VAITRFRLVLFALVLSVGTVTGPLRASAQTDATAFISQLGTQAIQVLGPSVSPPARLQRFRELFGADFDLPGIGQFVLGRYWRIATPEQQQQFLGLLKEYLAQAYAGRLAEYAGEQFQALTARQEGGDTIVASQIIRNDGGKIRVEWHLVNKDGWKITDAYVAGVSMAVTERDEFASVIQQGGGQVQYLLDRLRQKVSG